MSDDDKKPVKDQPLDKLTGIEPKAKTPPASNLKTHAPYRLDTYDVKNVDAAVALPTVRYSGFEKILESQNSLRMASTTETEKWASVLTRTADIYHKNGLFEKALDDLNREWTQSPEHDGKRMVVSRPKISAGSGKASGDAAMLRVRSLAGLGTVSNVPLPVSGFWVKMKAPTDDTLLMLDGLIANEKYTLGRMTYGQAFSHASVFITKHLVDCIVDHIYDSSLEDSSPLALRNAISELDYPTLIHGFLCTIYPNGYELAQPCIANIGKCSHVSTGRVSIPKLLWTDDTALSEGQKRNLAQRNRVVTKDDLDKHSKELLESLSCSSIRINAHILINLKAPSLTKHIEAGQTWIRTLVDTIDDGMRLNSDERDAFLMKRSQAQIMCTYSSWVENIITVDEDGEIEATIDDDETITNTLINLSEDADICDAFLGGVATFIDAATISMVGVGDFTCPDCGKSQLGEEDATGYREIIPINIESVFFSLTRQRLEQMLNTRKI